MREGKKRERKRKMEIEKEVERGRKRGLFNTHERLELHVFGFKIQNR